MSAGTVLTVARPPDGSCQDCGGRLVLVDQGEYAICVNGCHPLGVSY